MERTEAISKLKQLIGSDLYEIAREYRVPIKGKSGRKNKGWAGHTIERYLGLPLNSSQCPNFGSWELKVVPLKKLRNGKIKFKETMAITMIDPINVINTLFEDSHLYLKLRKVVVVTRLDDEEKSFVKGVFEINLDDNPNIFKQVKKDYEEVRNILINASSPEEGLKKLSGEMGVYIQPRTKGKGHGSISRAFYARKQFLECFFTPENIQEDSTGENLF